MSLEQELLDIKEKLDKLTQKRDQLQGGLDQLIKSMKDRFQVDTPEEASDKLQLWEEELENIEKELENHILDIKKTYQKLLELK